MADLRQVFGVATEVNGLSYVDRGGLDERFAYVLKTQRHIAVHGDSKQGKSWLRARALGAGDTIRVQCQVDTTPELILTEALGQLGVRAELHKTQANEVQGTLDLSAAGELGLNFLAKFRAELEAEVSAKKSSQTESVPVGQAPANLYWVARIISASGKRLVIEDFHYIAEEHQRRFSYMLKAIGEYNVYPVVVGIWPQDHLLTYYNGDLEGRVEDIRLRWDDAELDQVLVKGSDALNIKFASPLRRALIEDAYGNVGLVQRLAEQVCLQEGIRATQSESRTIEVGASLDRARREVAGQMQARFQAFADNFVRGMRRLSEGLEVYRHLLQTFTGTEDKELIAGIDSAQLLERIVKQASSIRQSDLTQALERVDRLQVKIQVNPLVLTYSKDGRKVFLADRAFLFFRKYGGATWPWDRGEFPTNDLAKTEPLILD
jgi:hypothetical protein